MLRKCFALLRLFAVLEVVDEDFMRVLVLRGNLVVN